MRNDNKLEFSEVELYARDSQNLFSVVLSDPVQPFKILSPNKTALTSRNNAVAAEERIKSRGHTSLRPLQACKLMGYIGGTALHVYAPSTKPRSCIADRRGSSTT